MFEAAGLLSLNSPFTPNFLPGRGVHTHGINCETPTQQGNVDQSEGWKSVLQPIKSLPSAAVHLSVRIRTSSPTGLLEPQLSKLGLVPSYSRQGSS